MKQLKQQIECPEELNAYLADICGVNMFGEPMFRLIWAQNEPFFVGHNQPSWLLQKWVPPEMFGSPEMFYEVTVIDDVPVMGEFPYFGCYETLVSFCSKEYDPETRELVIEPLELSWSVIERAIPMLLDSLELSYWEKKAAIEREQAYENARKVNEIADRLHDDMPTFYGPTSHAEMRNRTALIDRKSAEIEKQWKRAASRPMRGMYQGRPN